MKSAQERFDAFSAALSQLCIEHDVELYVLPSYTLCVSDLDPRPPPEPLLNIDLANELTSQPPKKGNTHD